MDRGRPSASYIEQLLGYGCGVSAVSITRRLLALWQSSCGNQTLQGTNYALARAAPVAAAKARRFSTQAFIAGIQMKALSDKMRLPPVRY
jgi:hypothetical protein